MRKNISKILKIIGILILCAFIVLVVLFYRFSTPKSDEYIKNDFAEEGVEVYIKHQKFKKFKYRILTTHKEIDSTIPTLVFIHGSVGSALDFKSYLKDSLLNVNANLITYDRIGYGLDQTGDVQESIEFEASMLEAITKGLKLQNTILIGYSYGGPITLASKKDYKKIMLLAPAVYSKVEPMPWALNMYKWSATRWLMPDVWKAASKEKLSHKTDLEKFENSWNSIPSQVISIHGNEDWIVPYENSLYLKKIFDANQFELVTLEGAGHGLVWTRFEDIKSIILHQLKE